MPNMGETPNKINDLISGSFDNWNLKEINIVQKKEKKLIKFNSLSGNHLNLLGETNIEKILISPQSKLIRNKTDFICLDENRELINKSIDKSEAEYFRNLKASDLKMSDPGQDFGEFGIFKHPNSKFGVEYENKTLPEDQSNWDIQSSDDDESSDVRQTVTNPESKSALRALDSEPKYQGPRIDGKSVLQFEKYEDSSVKIHKQEIDSFNSSEPKRPNGKFNPKTKPSDESEHLKVSMGKTRKSSKKVSVSKDSFKTLKGSKISEIFCLERKHKEKCPPSRFNQKMKNNTRFISMLLKKNRQKGSHRNGILESSVLNSKSTHEESSLLDFSQNQFTVFFFKSLIRLARIYLEKLHKPKYCLKCLLFLEKNHQVDCSADHLVSTETYKSLESSASKLKTIRLLGSADSIEDFIRETHNKVFNGYASDPKKTRLTPVQASQLFYLLGKTHLMLEDRVKAEEKLILAHVYDPKNFDCLFLLAETHYKQGQFRKAEKFYRKAHFTSPANDKALYGLADCNLREKNFDFLVKFAENLEIGILTCPKVCLLFVKSILQLLSISDHYSKIRRKKMVDLLKRLLVQAENSLLNVDYESLDSAGVVKLRNDIAIKYFKVKKYQSGIDCLLEIERDSLTGSSHYNLAYAYFKLGNLSQASMYIDMSLQVYPEHTKGLLLKAEISKKKGDLKTSLGILQKLHEVKGSDPVVNQMLGDIFKFKGSYFQAIEHYEVRF